MQKINNLKRNEEKFTLAVDFGGVIARECGSIEERSLSTSLNVRSSFPAVNEFLTIPFVWE